MSAWQIHSFGGPDVMQLRTVPIPVAGPGDVTIAVDACGVCRHDMLTREGAFPRAKLPVTLGHQVSGRVHEVGRDVLDMDLGQRVIVLPLVGCGECASCAGGNDAHCLRDNPRFLGEDYDGGYAEYVTVPERAVVPLPDSISAIDAAILCCTFGTAYHALSGRARVSPGEIVVITGASGGVGSHAIQVAKALDLVVVAVVSSCRRAEVATAAGADHVIVSPKRDFAPAVRETVGRRVDVVVDFVGGSLLSESIRAVRTGGRVVVAGNVEGGEAQIAPGMIILKEVSLIGTKSVSGAEMSVVLDMVGAGVLTPQVGEIRPLSDARAVHEDLLTGFGRGRVVLGVTGAQVRARS